MRLLLWILWSAETSLLALAIALSARRGDPFIALALGAGLLVLRLFGLKPGRAAGKSRGLGPALSLALTLAFGPAFWAAAQGRRKA